MVYTSFPRDSFIVIISMYFGATLEVACSSCHGDLVIYVRGARDAPLGRASLISQFVL